ncbi:MAG TPA: rod shape-determining protein MreC [Leucothrix mucor]|nr:rod shape-determining protein MreC [Leucothrix mucor]
MNDIIDNNSQGSLLFKFILLIVSSAAVMTVDYRGTALLQPVRTALTMLVYPLQYAIDIPFSTSSYLTDYFSDHKKMAAENRQLRTTLNIYAARNQKYHAIASENRRLRDQLNAITSVEEHFVLAEILSVSGNTFRRKVTIGRGANENIYSGQVVVAGKNIYGQIDSIAPNSAEIMQITDTDHAIHVRNERTNSGALAVGTGKTNLLELKNIEANVDIKEGDIYVSSGLGRLYPANYPVAVVSSIAYNSGDSFMKVMARTLTDFTVTREVLAIWQAKKAATTKDIEPKSQLKKNKEKEKEKKKQKVINKKVTPKKTQ